MQGVCKIHRILCKSKRQASKQTMINKTTTTTVTI